MIPNGVGTYFREIGLVEVLWKSISGIINRRISSCIQFHDNLHGFCVEIVAGTATLKEKLLQKLIAMMETVLHSIFFDLLKAYNALDRYRCLDILAGCGLVPRMLRILRTYWVRIQMVAKAGVYCGPVLHSHRGVTQGGGAITHDL